MNRDQMNAAFGVTDEQLESLAADYESGDWKGRLGPVVQGRPRLYEEDFVPHICVAFTGHRCAR